MFRIRKLKIERILRCVNVSRVIHFKLMEMQLSRILVHDHVAICCFRAACLRLIAGVDADEVVVLWCWVSVTDRKTSSTVATPRATLPPPLTALGPCPPASPSSPLSPPYYPSGCGSTLDSPLPPPGRQIGDRGSDTYIPLDECFSGARPVTHYPRSANASPQVCCAVLCPCATLTLNMNVNVH